MVGDTWNIRGSKRTDDGSSHPDMQLNVMNSRVVALIAQDPDRWALAGDQLYVDLDLSEANLPSGTRLMLGTATIEVTDQPHTGCAKFTRRFGLDAFHWVNDDAGSKLRLRGLNARVVVPGVVRRGDVVTKIAGTGSDTLAMQSTAGDPARRRARPATRMPPVRRVPPGPGRSTRPSLRTTPARGARSSSGRQKNTSVATAKNSPGFTPA